MQLLTISLTESKNSKDSDTLKKKIDELTVNLTEKNSEIEGLKDTIRRECEERTMMIIKMSDMKDQLAKYKKMGIDVAVSGHGRLSNSDYHGDPATTRGLLDTNIAVDIVSKTSHAVSEEDMNWAQKLARQSSKTNKSKRPSKYR
jgi:hypothetical protein